MTGGWLEHEIRSIPQVLACSIGKDDVVVLVHPSADPVLVERAVTDLLATRGIDRPVRVFGGVRPVFAEPVRIRGTRPALVASVGGAIVLAAGVFLAGSGVGLRRAAPSSRPPAAALAPPLHRELVEIPELGTHEPPLPPQGTIDHTPTTPILRPVSRPIFRPADTGKPGVSKPGISKPRPPRPVVVPSSCRAPHAGVALKPKRGLGNGPPAWSHSIHVAPHCTHGRPK